MNIIVPIHLEGLRVTNSTSQQGLDALYDFTTMGTEPVSSLGGLVAAENFQKRFVPLSSEPGIHLHWSIPRAYTHGQQNAASAPLGFPTLPNRWLIARFYQLAGSGKGQLKMWLMESDAYGQVAGATIEGGAVPKSVPIPVYNQADGIYGLGNTLLGDLYTLDCATKPCWTEGQTKPGVNHLQNQLQAPFAYGTTFTAYYKNSAGAFGFYDTLSDLGVNLQDTQFSVSYAVIGWVGNMQHDRLHQLLAAYDPKKDPNFQQFVQGVFESKLLWMLDSYKDITTQNYQQVQAIFSGIMGGAYWNSKQGAAHPSYPSPLPNGQDLGMSVGNNSAEAISRYITEVEKGSSTDMPPDVTQNLEWLLNAFQYGQVQKMSSGETGVGQIDEYLHDRSFGTADGGRMWRVMAIPQKGKVSPSTDAEASLPLPLAELLTHVNASQAQQDRLVDELNSQQKKTFLDWSYHMNILYDNVFKQGANKPITDDNTGAYLLDGILQTFPTLAASGTGLPQRKNLQFPITSYVPEPFNIKSPNQEVPSLASYNFNAQANTIAAKSVTDLLNLQYNLEAVLPDGVHQLVSDSQTALLLLDGYVKGSSNADQYIQQAITLLKDVQTNAGNLVSTFAMPTSKTNGIDPIMTLVQNAITKIEGWWTASPKSGSFQTWFPINNGGLNNKPYKGKIATAQDYNNAGAWAKTGAFPGIQDILNQLTGTGNYQPLVLDLLQAAVHLATCYLWRHSGVAGAAFSVAYCIELVEKTLTDTAATGTQIINDLKAAQQAYQTFAEVGIILKSLSDTTANGAIQKILDLLKQNPPDVAGAVKALQALFNGPSKTDLLTILQQDVQSTNWQSMAGDLKKAWQSMAGLLPKTHEVYLTANFLYGKVEQTYLLEQTPAPKYYFPSEPVVVLGEGKSGNHVLGPVNRNGRANLLPCRLDTELVQDNKITYPTSITDIGKTIKPQPASLVTPIMQLLEEAYLLTPDFLKAGVSSQALADAAQYNKTQQQSLTSKVPLNPASGNPNDKLPYTVGKLPYFIAFNYWLPVSGTIDSRPVYNDVFLPLMIYWEAEYVFSTSYDVANENYPANYLTGLFKQDQYSVAYQPDSVTPFEQSKTPPNFMDLKGVISLSSAVTANLNTQIRKFCMESLNYDPKKGPPPTNDPLYQEKMNFYKAYNGFSNWDLLAQGMSGFNSSLIQRFQELQIPINVPMNWLKAEGNNKTAFWVTQFLHDQSANWPENWMSEGLNYTGADGPNQTAFFTPFRGGFMQIKTLSIVDVFGRKVDVPPQKPVVSEAMTTTDGKYPTNYDIYLKPTLNQESRLNVRWVASMASDGATNFVEYNPHPAASPICGWLLPNHLDESLMVYDANGTARGSLGRKDTQLHWFPVPGQSAFDPKSIVNPVLKGFLEGFTPNNSPFANFQGLMNVIDGSQQFIIGKNLHEDAGLAVLIGRPLVLAQVSISLELKGLPDVSSDAKGNRPTFIPFNGANSAFELDSNGYIAYNFANFNNASLPMMQVPVYLGEAEISKPNSAPIPYFDDGLVGFFVQDFKTFYTPLPLTQQLPGIISTYQLAPAQQPIQLTPDGKAITITLLLDPRIGTRASTGILPVNAFRIPPDQFNQAMNNIMSYFLTAPLLTYHQPSQPSIQIPVPDEKGYVWNWAQIGSPDLPVVPPQTNTLADFPLHQKQKLVDGWLKLIQQ